jgi:hypothetical protein
MGNSGVSGGGGAPTTSSLSLTRGHLASNTAVTIGNAAIAIPYDTIDVGSANWNASTHTWTCPATGNYFVHFSVADNGNGLASSYATITPVQSNRLHYNGPTALAWIEWSDVLHFNSGDTFQFLISNDNNGTAKNLSANYNWFSIQQLTAG